MKKYNYEENNSKHYRLYENEQKHRRYSTPDSKRLKIKIFFRIPFLLYFVGKRLDVNKITLFTKEYDTTLTDIYFWREI